VHRLDSPISEAYPKAIVLGCGTGRHVSSLAREGYSVCGCDILESAIGTARERLKREGLYSEVWTGDADSTGAPDQSFDLVVAWGLLMSTSRDKAVAILREAYRVLKPGGHLIGNWRTTDDCLTRCGLKMPNLGPNTFVLDARANEHGLTGCTYNFASRLEIAQLLEDPHAGAAFHIENLERKDFWTDNLSHRFSWWMFTARKP
jgi:ubiquinone/menaquinone biosynthesis C-methylase UbiE